jgi:hypothetical protein
MILYDFTPIYSNIRQYFNKNLESTKNKMILDLYTIMELTQIRQLYIYNI